MKVLAAYLLSVLGGKAAPTAADVTAVLKSVGIEADAAEVTLVVAQLSGKDVNEIIAAGSKKLATVPSGGAAAPAAASAAAPAAAKEEKKKEEKKEESDDVRLCFNCCHFSLTLSFRIWASVSSTKRSLSCLCKNHAILNACILQFLLPLKTAFASTCPPTVII